MSQAPALLLDTTVLIDALRNRNRRRGLLADLVSSGRVLVTSTISVAEIYGGIRPGEEQATGALFDAIDCFPVSSAIAERAGQLKAAIRRQGETRSIVDMIVAATALENGFTVATDNGKDFQVPGLALYPLP
jgi:predicted nucleic acid-binding protein